MEPKWPPGLKMVPKRSQNGAQMAPKRCQKEFKKLYNDKYDCMLIGIGGFFASLSWFYAFTLIQASFVRAVGQIELLFSYEADLKKRSLVICSEYKKKIIDEYK